MKRPRTTPAVELGTRIRQFRKKAGLSQHEVSVDSDVPATSISSYECGRRRPDVDTLRSIAAALGVGLDELLEGVQ